MEAKQKNKGTIFYIDDDGRQKSTHYDFLDESHPNLIKFKSINNDTLVTLPLTRLLKIKTNGGSNE